MAMNIDSTTLEQLIDGMKESIFQEMDNLYSELFDDEKVLKDAQEGWRKLSQAIARGILVYMNEHLDVKAEGNTAQGGADMHVHDAALSLSINKD